MRKIINTIHELIIGYNIMFYVIFIGHCLFHFGYQSSTELIIEISSWFFGLQDWIIGIHLFSISYFIMFYSVKLMYYFYKRLKTK